MSLYSSNIIFCVITIIYILTKKTIEHKMRIIVNDIKIIEIKNFHLK